MRKDIGEYIRRVCDYKGAEIVEKMPVDHIHILIKDH